MELKVGDVVKLKTGGPMMTVEKFEPHVDWVECIWFTQRTDGTWDGLFRDTFPIAFLEFQRRM